VHQGINEDKETQITGGRATSVVDDEYHYIRTGRGAELLFATAADWEERHNLVGIDSLKPVLERTRRYLSTRLGQDWVPGIH
jgi:hypothetical protein